MSAVLAFELPPITEALDRFDLLRDDRGVYGLAFIPAAGPRQVDDGPLGYFTRPDKLDPDHRDTPGYSPALQPIPSLKAFRSSIECQMADALFTKLLARAGIRRWANHNSWWSNDPGQQAANRRRFHAYKRQAVGITNSLVRQALAVADQDALRVARRFNPDMRWQVYKAGARSPRLRQLAETFPLLLYGILIGDSRLSREAAELVERGARLRDAAELMQVPMAYRRVHPALCWRVSSWLGTPDGAELLPPQCVAHRLPAKLPEQRLWIWAMGHAYDAGGGPYSEWVARHALELGEHVEQVRAQTADIGDWIKACYVRGIPRHVLRALGGGYAGVHRPTAALVTRPFSPDMSVRTVRDLAGAWHEAVALAAPETRVELPPPWRDATAIGDLEIVPLAAAVDIAAEGRVMHHCAQSYIPNVARGACQLFSVRKGDQRLATVEVQPDGAGVVRITQMRGPCNALVPKSLQLTLQRWCRQRGAWRIREPETWHGRRAPLRAVDPEDDGLGDEIPF